MRIVFLSDTHNQLHSVDVPDGDVLVHAGDATMLGSLVELSKFNQAMGQLPHRHKLFSPGNHDILCERDPGLAATVLTKVTWLKGCLSVGTPAITFWGCPYTPRFGAGWAFQLKDKKHAKEIWDTIPEKVDIVVTHGPVYGILDEVRRPSWSWQDADVPGAYAVNVEHVGCPVLAKTLKRIRPRIHVCGHVHGGYGTKVVHGTQYINASNCNESYDPVNAPIILEV